MLCSIDKTIESLESQAPANIPDHMSITVTYTDEYDPFALASDQNLSHISAMSGPAFNRLVVGMGFSWLPVGMGPR